jgi:hypothetical protein
MILPVVTVLAQNIRFTMLTTGRVVPLPQYLPRRLLDPNI